MFSVAAAGVVVAHNDHNLVKEAAGFTDDTDEVLFSISISGWVVDCLREHEEPRRVDPQFRGRKAR